MARNTLAQIDVDALAHNVSWVRARTKNVRLMAVVKADAYGHRLDLCLPALGDVDLLGVATIEEARYLRQLGHRGAIVLMEGVIHEADLAVAAELELELTIHHAEQLTLLERAGEAPAARLWLKLDSGMNRLGLPLSAAAEAHARLLRLKGVEQVNLVSHFATADAEDRSLMDLQVQRFDQAVAGLEAEQCLANSAAVLKDPSLHRDWVRVGILLYGISPLPGQTGAELGLKPVMRLSAELMAINDVKQGEVIGYGGRFRASQDLRVGVVAIGYGDGYPRSAVDGTPVQVAGQQCPLVGRVSMDMITVDLSGCPGARIGDPVTVWGDGVPVEVVAAHADTIPWDLVCRITRRVRYRRHAIQ